MSDVAIIDDDPAVLDSLKLLLESAGHAVRSYTSAAAFLRDVGAHPSCLVLDQNMPQMTGLELIDWLHRHAIAIPILLITGFPSPVTESRATALGVEKVLGKPVRERDLLNFVNAHSWPLPE